MYAVSPTEIYVTNDHRYYDGLWRTLEDMWPGAMWSDVIHATLSAADGSVEARVAVDKLHNPNGLGHGRDADEILLASAVGGYVQLGRRSADGGGSTIVLDDVIDLESAVDNPSWYADPYAGAAGDASGFVFGGITRAIDIAKTGGDPEGKEGVMVWHVKPSNESEAGKWEKTLLWQDDGSNIRNAATAVLVGIDPQQEGGKKRGWLFVTGFSSENAVAVKVDL